MNSSRHLRSFLDAEHPHALAEYRRIWHFETTYRTVNIEVFFVKCTLKYNIFNNNKMLKKVEKFLQKPANFILKKYNVLRRLFFFEKCTLKYKFFNNNNKMFKSIKNSFKNQRILLRKNIQFLIVFFAAWNRLYSLP